MDANGRRRQAKAAVKGCFDEIFERGQQAAVKGQEFAHPWLASDEDSTYLDHPDYKRALEFKADFSPTLDGDDYRWVCDYAQHTYDLLHDTFKYLDEKADSIIKYLGGGTAIAALAAVASVTGENAWAVLMLTPSLCCALKAVRLAMKVRAPVKTPGPPTIYEAIRYAEFHREKAEATFLGLWFATCEGLAAVNAKKARELHGASRWYYRTLACLALPLLAWPVWRLVEPARVPTAQKIEIISPSSPIDPNPRK